MRKKNYFLLALASLAFAACTSENLIDEGGGHVIGDNETAWISLSGNMRKPITHNLNTPK